MPKSTILLLSNDQSTLQQINQSLDSSKYKLLLTDETNLMATIYKTNTKLLLIDLDYYQESTIELVNSICSQEYLPIIYLFSQPYPQQISKLTDDQVVIHKSLIKETLFDNIKQTINFKTRYNKVIDTYNTIDSLNNKIDQLLKKYITNNFSNYENLIPELLNYVFVANKFLTNQPSTILTIFKHNNLSVIELYQVSKQNIEKVSPPITGEFDFSQAPDNEFLYNSATEELSDIDPNLFPEQLLTKLPAVNNFSGYATTDSAVVGLNYNQQVTNFDADVIKAISVNINLIENIYEQINQVQNAFIYTINALSRAAEVNDDDTGQHIKRVNEYSKLIAEKLGMKQTFVEEIYYSAQMHDVGKIHVPQQILSKPGSLTEEEFKTIKQHPVYGAEIIGDSNSLQMAAQIALNHHEKFDGSGYPHGKSGTEIPLPARIVMLADIYDALRSDRPYKSGFSHDKTYQIIAKGDGRVEPAHFDPDIHNLFKQQHQQFNEIYNLYS